MFGLKLVLLDVLQAAVQTTFLYFAKATAQSICESLEPECVLEQEAFPMMSTGCFCSARDAYMMCLRQSNLPGGGSASATQLQRQLWKLLKDHNLI